MTHGWTVYQDQFKNCRAIQNLFEPFLQGWTRPVFSNRWETNANKHNSYGSQLKVALPHLFKNINKSWWFVNNKKFNVTHKNHFSLKPYQKHKETKKYTDFSWKLHSYIVETNINSWDSEAFQSNKKCNGDPWIYKTFRAKRSCNLRETFQSNLDFAV